MNQNDIEQVLNYQMEQYVAANPIDVNYPNTDYKPVIGTSYLKADILYTNPEQIEFGGSGQNRCEGIYQITINVGVGKGKYAIMQLVDSLQTYFNRGTKIIRNGIKVSLTKFYLGPEFPETDWFRQPLSVDFRSDIDN